MLTCGQFSIDWVFLSVGAREKISAIFFSRKGKSFSQNSNNVIWMGKCNGNEAFLQNEMLMGAWSQKMYRGMLKRYKYICMIETWVWKIPSPTSKWQFLIILN